MRLSFHWKIGVLCLFFYPSRPVAGIELTGKTQNYTTLFKKIAEDFDSHEIGCPNSTAPVDAYDWRNSGYGSNINLMMLPWLYALLHDRDDIAIILEERHHFDLVKCQEESNGVEVHGGFSCLFAPMPHVCVFNTRKDWENFMIEQNVPIAERKYALNHATLVGVLDVAFEIERHLQSSGIDILTAKAVLINYMHSHWQVWTKRDIQSILDEPGIAALKEGPYIGLHIRRGDKIGFEAQVHEVQEYLQKAHSYIQNSAEASLSVDDIRGIWVSSDDTTVVFEVKQSFAEYFPSVKLERVVDISEWAFKIKKPLTAWAIRTNTTSKNNLPTTSDGMEYGAYINVFAELQMLTQANIFVGTFSSNVARLIVLMREARGMSRDSSLSLDLPEWVPTRQLLYAG